jgi:hypothetical protein
MDESLLRDILAAQKDMLAELRQIRVLLSERALRGGPLPDMDDYPGLGPDDVLPPPGPEPAEFTLEPDTPPAAPPPPAQPAGTFTPRELKELGQSFATPHAPKTRPKLVDVQDLRGSLVDEIKGKNRAKSRAFSEFSKYRRDD